MNSISCSKPLECCGWVVHKISQTSNNNPQPCFLQQHVSCFIHSFKKGLVNEHPALKADAVWLALSAVLWVWVASCVWVLTSNGNKKFKKGLLIRILIQNLIVMKICQKQRPTWNAKKHHSENNKEIFTTL